MKNNDFKTELLIIAPRSPFDIEDMIRYLRNHEASILVNMTKEKIANKAVNMIIQCILKCSDSQMDIKVKRVYPRVFICNSKRKIFK